MRLWERQTYHDARGRFVTPMAAVTVSRDGERLKVVRQYRRMARRDDAKPEPPSVPGLSPVHRGDVEKVVVRWAAGRSVAAMRGLLSGPGWVNVADLVDGQAEVAAEVER